MLSSANAFNLDKSKFLSCGKGLTVFHITNFLLNSKSLQTAFFFNTGKERLLLNFSFYQCFLKTCTADT